MNSASVSGRPCQLSHSRAVSSVATSRRSARAVRNGNPVANVLASIAPFADRAAEVAQDSSAARPYAVIDVGGTRQYVEEGSSFACLKKAIGEVSLGGTVKFPKVLAIKQDGQLHKGRPYLEGCLVEGRLEDEFRGPNSGMSMSSEDSQDEAQELVLRRILITRIQQA